MDAWSSEGDGGRGGNASRPEPRPPTERFPPRDRIRKRRDYRQAYDQGHRQGGRAYVLFLHPNDLGRSRLGITATRRVGPAVVRNRMKRTVREIFRRNRDAFPAMDVVVHIRPAAAGLPFPVLRRDLLDTARRAHRRLEARGR